MIKSICLAVSLGLIALALIGVTSAAAAVSVESCMKVGKECKAATVGTTYQTISKEFVIEEEEEVLDKCELTTTHEVADPTSESAEDPIEVVTTKATFSSCSGSEGALKANGLPWTWTSTETELEESREVELMGYGFTGTFCEWVLNAPDDLVTENVDTRFVKGTMLGQGSFFCSLLLLNVGHVLAMNGVNDPNLAGAVDIIVS